MKQSLFHDVSCWAEHLWRRWTLHYFASCSTVLVASMAPDTCAPKAVPTIHHKPRMLKWLRTTEMGPCSSLLFPTQRIPSIPKLYSPELWYCRNDTLFFRIHCPSLGITIYPRFLFTGWLRVNMFESLLPPTTSWNMDCVYCLIEKAISYFIYLIGHDTNHSEQNSEYLVVKRENKCTHTSLECDNPLLSLDVLGRRFPISRSCWFNSPLRCFIHFRA